MATVTTQVFTWARSIVAGMLGALKTVPGGALLTTPTIVLLTDSVPITPDDAVSNHTIATFSGYAAATISLSGPVNIGVSSLASIANALFIATTASPFVGDTITGYLLTDGVNAFYGGEMFASGIPIAGPDDFIDLALLLPINMHGAAA